MLEDVSKRPDYEKMRDWFFLTADACFSLKQLSDEGLEEFWTCGAIVDGVHIYKDIEVLAALDDLDLHVAKFGDCSGIHPYLIFCECRGTRFYQLAGGGDVERLCPGQLRLMGDA